MPGPNTDLCFFPLLMHRRKDLWGEDADDFNPERWLDEQRVMEFTQDPFRFLPFNAGPRICLGQVSVVVTSTHFSVYLLCFSTRILRTTTPVSVSQRSQVNIGHANRPHRSYG